ncbi:MAG: SDR family oxidoreductase [Reyranella sp.]|nr:MAG: SDR family oxidoreductase [Reyranella sp.]
MIGKTILVVGVTGFIGAAVACRLHAAGASVVGVSRSPSKSAVPLRHVRLDVASASEPATWGPVLVGVDAVVYCAGALQDGPGESLQAVHETGPAALYHACAEAGVRRIVHLSALGVDNATTDFSRSKLAGDQILMDSDLDWVVLRPSVVIGRNAFGGPALLRGLAALPVVPVPEQAAALQIVHIDDLLDTILFFVRPAAPARLVLDVVGLHAWRFDEVVGLFRRWLGWRPAIGIRLPRWLAAVAFAFGDFLGRLGWQTALRSNAGAELLRAAPGDPIRWIEQTGIVPRDIERTLLLEPASVQERWFARLYLLRPCIFVLCALFWIATGVVALGPGWDHGIGLMNEGGIFGWAAAAVVVAGALCDIAVGAAIGWRRTARLGVWAAIAVSVVYAIVGTVLVPRLWSDPMGPMLKVLPILVLHLAALGLVEDR